MVSINPKPEQKFPALCAWCGCVCGFMSVKNSHGICTECSDLMLLELRTKITDPRGHKKEVK